MKARTYIIFLVLTVLSQAIILDTLYGGLNIRKGGDSIYYHKVAVNLVKKGAYSKETFDPSDLQRKPAPTALRPPGYPLFLAAIYSIFGEHPLVAITANFLLLIFASIGIFLIANTFLSTSCAQISGFLAATYLPIVHFARLQLSELLAICIFIYAVYFSKKFIDNPSFLSAGLSGGLLAAASLVRGTLVLTALIFAIGFIICGYRKKLLTKDYLFKLLIFLVSFFFVIFPWILRNKITMDQWTLGMANNSLYASMLQYNEKVNIVFSYTDWKMWKSDSRKRYKKAAKGAIGEAQVNEGYLKSAQDEFYQLNTQRFIRVAAKKVFYLWGGKDALRVELSRRLYILFPIFLGFWLLLSKKKIINRNTFWYGLFGVLYLCSLHDFYRERGFLHTIMIFALNLAGMWFRRKSFVEDWLLWVPAVYLTLLHLVFHVEPRYFFPARMFLLIYAAIAVITICNNLSLKEKM